jgi:excisionase family DNA binding protein
MKKLIIENISLDELKELIQDALQNAISSNKPEEEFLNIQEASAFTKIPLTTIYDYTSNQKIPFHKKGKKLFFVKQELSQWLKTNQKKEGGAP